MSNAMNVDQVLNQIRSLRQEAASRIQANPVAPQGEALTRTSFDELLSQSVNSVSATQKHAAALAASFERGDSNTSLAEVMVASQKSSVSFTAMVEVRNKMIDAYQEVMRMSV